MGKRIHSEGSQYSRDAAFQLRLTTSSLLQRLVSIAAEVQCTARAEEALGVKKPLLSLRAGTGDTSASHMLKASLSPRIPIRLELPSVEELTIILPEDIELKPLGMVSSIIEQLGRQFRTAAEDRTPETGSTVLTKCCFLATGTGLYSRLRSLLYLEQSSVSSACYVKVFEIFGPVAHPFYVLRFNSSDHIESKGIKIKETMYFAPSMEDFTQYIFTDKLQQDRGSDASWKNDQEPPPDALDFSDDEKEKEAKQRKKSQIQGRKKLKSECSEPGEDFAEVHQNWNAHGSALEHAKGYRNREFTRGFSRGRYPRPCHRPLQGYSSEHRASQETSGFPPQRQDSPVMPQYPFPPPVFDMHSFSLPPPPPPFILDLTIR
ncbi:H/ACA ribonucleoprotein complex non-core subunit NAF1 [Tupaia chinensis]|uniref:H/ACA ribonucleoprotein complex non-core subunit NAF1 n=1 Tax=Tupaia chinensis TaxID=246437 RepID=L9JR02_TUPCH|nr:H/ACA ribonucleoprotein complex non-core subunit NAF1 [Tupaia chinensis]